MSYVTWIADSRDEEEECQVCCCFCCKIGSKKKCKVKRKKLFQKGILQ